jgi:hypothetical protein
MLLRLRRTAAVFAGSAVFIAAALGPSAIVQGHTSHHFAKTSGKAQSVVVNAPFVLR